MGLGLRSLVLCSLTQMAEEVHGFVEFIDEAEEARTGIFQTLVQNDHPSLFYGVTEDLIISNGVLYGPACLCNSNEWVNGIYNPVVIQFVNFHRNGRESRWSLQQSWGVERFVEFGGTAHEMKIHSQYHHVELATVEGEDPFHDDDDVDYTMATPGYSRSMVSENTAVSFPRRITFEALNEMHQIGIDYDHLQEIMVAYDAW